jgi:hypothetical protein
MEYMTRDELRRVLRIAKEKNELHWQMIVTGFYFGLRVSEVISILGVIDHLNPQVFEIDRWSPFLSIL